MTAKDPRSTRAWRKLKAMHLAEAASSSAPLICWRCELPIEPGQAVDLGHLTDQALAEPGMPVRVALEHRSCNRAAGHALSRELLRRPRVQNTAWITTELRVTDREG
ncbi:hypothetical protein [Microlunatus ginsengisoli]|uniref:HNH endonuclease n=1 Tax=Microlunatus ginsengisoli TaxID=363863 RepID=A0ABP6ZX12_9ACTN